MLIKGTPDVLFAPKTPGAFGGLGLSISDLPANWSSYSPAQKIAYFNENLIVPNELLTAGVSQSDIDWMMDNGYDVQKIELELASNARLKADFEAAEAARIAAERAAAERAAAEAADAARAAADAARAAAEEAAKPAMVGNVILPTGFSDYSAAQKIKFFNDNLITPEQLLQAGVSQSDIDWMVANGYKTQSGEIVMETNVFTEPETIGNVALPSNWSTYTAAQKIAFFNAMSITEIMLLDAGVDVDDITWMKANGYTGRPTSPTPLPKQISTPTPTNAALPLIIAAAAAYLIGG